MAGLMYGDGIFLLVGGNLRTFLKASDYTVNSINEILLAYRLFVMTSRNKSRLVTYIGYIRT